MDCYESNTSSIVDLEPVRTDLRTLTNQCPVPGRPINANPGLKFCSLLFFTDLCIA